MVIRLVIFVLALLVINIEDSIGENISHENSFCEIDGDSKSCRDVVKELHGYVGNWRAFVPTSLHLPPPILIAEYAAWHNRTLFNSKISCKEKLSFVFEPNAGLGDSIGALVSAFTYAVRSGR